MNATASNAIGLTAARPRRVCVVGAGYVGLTAAACMAELGHTVSCLEAQPDRLALLLDGGIPIHEPGLAELVARQVALGRLSFTGDAGTAMNDVGLALLCVGTPPREDGDPDLRQLARAVTEVTAAATSDLVLVVKSTVPPGTCEALEVIARGKAGSGLEVDVVSNPEFLREGEAVWDFLNPDRLVIGAADPDLAALVAELYPAHWPAVLCDRRSAELVKYASNTFLAIKVSFANEVAALCEALGAEAGPVLAGVGLDGRIGCAFLGPGAGYGGSCLPKDLAGFVAVAASVGQEAAMARAAREVNVRTRAGLVDKLHVALGGLSGRRITVLGLAFKAGTDDLRDSPAIGLIREIAGRGGVVTAHDPMARAEGLDAVQVDEPYEAVAGADAIVVATAWPVYRRLDAVRLRHAMRGHVVLDAVGTLDCDALEASGFDVYRVGGGRPLRLHPVVWRPLEWMIPQEATMAT